MIIKRNEGTKIKSLSVWSSRRMGNQLCIFFNSRKRSEEKPVKSLLNKVSKFVQILVLYRVEDIAILNILVRSTNDD